MTPSTLTNQATMTVTVMFMTCCTALVCRLWPELLLQVLLPGAQHCFKFMIVSTRAQELPYWSEVPNPVTPHTLWSTEDAVPSWLAMALLLQDSEGSLFAPPPLQHASMPTLVVVFVLQVLPRWLGFWGPASRHCFGTFCRCPASASWLCSNVRKQSIHRGFAYLSWVVQISGNLCKTTFGHIIRIQNSTNSGIFFSYLMNYLCFMHIFSFFCLFLLFVDIYLHITVFECTLLHMKA